MDSRRKFIGAMATGLASTLASSAGVLGANDRVRVGVIGAGQRGTELVHQAMACPNVEVAAFADVYNKRLDDVRKLVPAAAAYNDHRQLLCDQSIDAVIVATPQHLHCEHFVHALEAGKHVYQEKTLAFTLDDARRMRAAYRQAPKAVVQIGRRSRFSGYGPRRQNHGDSNALVSQHPARQGAMGAAGVSRHDAREHCLELLLGRRAPPRLRSESLHQLALL